MLQQDSDEEEELEDIDKKPYVPEEFADFSVYNASLDNREWLSSRGDLANSRVLEKEVSRSPTTSSITSGYFSHSASNATLSDMLVPSSDSTDQLANQMKDLDSNDHSAAHLARDLRFSNKEALEAGKDLAKDEKSISPAKENSALAREVPLSESSINTDATKLHCSALDSSANKSTQHEIEFMSREAVVEHTSNVFEDHAFTEFMGAADGKEYSGVSQFCSGAGPGRRKKLSTTNMNCDSDFSRTCNQDNPVSHPKPTPVEYQLSNTVENPLLAVVVKETSYCQMYADPFLGEDFTGKTSNVSSCEHAASEELPSWVAVGEQVCISSSKTGIVRYVGPVDFSAGTWVGIELHLQMGKK